MKHGDIVRITSGGLQVGKIGVVRRNSPHHGHTIDILNKKMTKVVSCSVGLRSMNLEKLDIHLKECPCDECDYHRQFND